MSKQKTNNCITHHLQIGTSGEKLVIFLSVIILPIVFIFLIYGQIKNICKPANEYAQIIGTVEAVGITTRTFRGDSFRSWPFHSKNRVFFVKLVGNDMLYSFYSRDKKYEILINSLDKGDEVIIYNNGYDKRQNTVDIIQLETPNNILISKTEYNSKECILLIWFTILLILYFYIPYRFLFKKKKKKNYYHE